GLGWSEVISPQQIEADPTLLSRKIREKAVGEVVFCAKDMAWSSIITHMEEVSSSRVELKIAQPGISCIVGPSSIESLQDLFVLDGHTLASEQSLRMKRLFDVVLSI